MSKGIKKRSLSMIIAIVFSLAFNLNFEYTQLKANASTVIDRAIEWAVNIANDDSHGYDQASRWGPDYDCASLVIAAFKNAGVDVGGATYTGDMCSELGSHGFSLYAFDRSILQRGDIMWRSGHTELYIGNNQQVGAHINENGGTRGGATGDQTGHEIDVQSYYNNSWSMIIRYNDSSIPSAPRIENPRIAQVTNTGYIVQCEVYNEINPVTRVAFPTWTTKTDSSGNDQDDLIWADGTISGATATFEVKISDHNNELGCYRTHIYCYNTTGASSAVAVSDVIIEQTKPTISNVNIISQTSSSYTVQCDVNDADSGIARVAFPTWTTKKDSSGNDQDDIIWADGNIKDGKATFEVKISDHNNELGYYRTHIYAYDNCGNSDAIAVPDIYIENTKPTISDVKIINQSSTSYTVQCKVVDNESGIDRVQFPTWTSLNDQDDIAKDWGSNKSVQGVLKDNIATFTVDIADHNNETGEYNTHIYAYDKCGNYNSYGVKVNLGVYKLTVDPNGGLYDNSTSSVTKEHILRYGFSYWGNIGEGEYGNATRNGYILTGYFDKPIGGTKVYDSNGLALDTEYFRDLTYFGDSDLTVYAQWQIIEGDVNADDEFNIADVVVLQNWLLGRSGAKLENWKAADLCDDNRLDVFDLCLMRRKLIYG